MERMSAESLAGQPISVCVLGIVVMALLTDVFHGQLAAEGTSGFDMLKTLPYYLLLVANVDSPARLRGFLRSLVAISALITGLGVAQYYGLISIPEIKIIEDGSGYDPTTGELIIVMRLASVGAFGGDSNDMSLMVVMALSICISELGRRRFLPLRLLWLTLIVLFVHALLLTGSRGGLMSMVLMIGIYAVNRFGWWKALVIMAATSPVALRFAGGRLLDFGSSLTEGTGQQRIQMWVDAIGYCLRYPLLGGGTGSLEAQSGRVAHNSFLHCYAELGFIGGTFYVGAFYQALRALQQLGSPGVTIADPELRHLRPCLLALVAGYCMGTMTLSCAYTVPTYLVLGLVAAYLQMVTVVPPLPIQRFNFGRLLVVSVGFLTVSYVYVRFSVRWGSN